MAVLASAAPVLACSVLWTPATGQRRVGGAPLLRGPGERARRLGLLWPAAPAHLRSAAAGWLLRASAECATAPGGGGRLGQAASVAARCGMRVALWRASALALRWRTGGRERLGA
jgi:hypothetical protein